MTHTVALVENDCLDESHAEPRWLNSSFADALDWGVAEFGDREAVVYGSLRISYAQLGKRVHAFARGLIELGVKPGDKVALWMSDRPEWLVARWAVPLIGAILVPVNTRFRGVDVEYVLAQSDSSTLIVQDGARGTSYFDILGEVDTGYESHPRGGWSSRALPELRRVIGLGQSAASELPSSMHRFEDVEARGAARQAGAEGPDDALRTHTRAVTGQTVAQILYTSGTTSFPKGAMVCHGPLLQNNYYATACLRLTPADRYLSCVPLFTATGTFYTLAMWLSGAAMVIADYFEPRLFCELVQRERITVSFFVETIVQDLKSFPDIGRYDLSSLRTGTGAPLSTESFYWVTNTLGVPQLISAYGMSETSNAVVRTRCEDPLAKRAGTNGRPVGGVRIRIAEVGTNRTLNVGEMGEICIAGYLLMKGYYKKPDEDGKVFDADGWLHSGDLGELDADGYLVYRGRVKEMIKPGGFNVATQEIELFLKTYPGVRQAAVVGVPDRRLGEVGYAYIEAQEGVQLAGEALQAYCKAHIASYKVPRYVEFITEWPLTGSQKIRKLELKARAERTLESRAITT
jgi:fatty-acyl-CoA synthase